MARKRRQVARETRLATPRQLWALNRAGRLKLDEDDELEPLTNAQADQAIKQSMAHCSTADGKHGR